MEKLFLMLEKESRKLKGNLYCHSFASRIPEKCFEIDSRLHGNDILICHSCESRNPENFLEMDSRFHGNDTSVCHSCESRNPENFFGMDSRCCGNDNSIVHFSERKNPENKTYSSFSIFRFINFYPKHILSFI